MKSFLLLTFCLLGVFASGCKKEYITEATPNRTILTSIATNAWQYDNDSKTYFTSIDMPELTPSVNLNSAVIVYISGDGYVWEQLPKLYNSRNYVTTHDEGVVYVEVQGPDSETVSPPNQTLQVKIVIVDSIQ